MKLNPASLIELDIADDIGIGDGIAPAGLILVDIRAAEIEMLAVEEEALVGGPLDRCGCRRA